MNVFNKIFLILILILIAVPVSAQTWYFEIDTVYATDDFRAVVIYDIWAGDSLMLDNQVLSGNTNQLLYTNVDAKLSKKAFEMKLQYSALSTWINYIDLVITDSSITWKAQIDTVTFDLNGLNLEFSVYNSTNQLQKARQYLTVINPSAVSLREFKRQIVEVVKKCEILDGFVRDYLEKKNVKIVVN